MRILILVSLSILLAACQFKDEKREVFAPPALEERKAVSELPNSTSYADLPGSVIHEVQFFPQAPQGNWSLPWKETCEEASIALGYHYYLGEKITLQDFKTDLLDMVEWQEKNFGYYKDTTISETAELLSGYYDFDDHWLLDEPTITDLKKELADNHLIVAPFAGQMLGNPYFTGLGPDYHMALIVGYDEEHFIVHDVGTRRGEDFEYEHETVMNALHDWVPSGEVRQGAKRVLVLE
jgi:hypothetical protein